MKIKGNVYIPQAGVQKAYIAGKSFEGDKMVDGKILNSKTCLYETDDKIVTELKKFLTYQVNFKHKTMNLKGKNVSSIIQSFASDTCIVMFSSKSINLYQSHPRSL